MSKVFAEWSADCSATSIPIPSRHAIVPGVSGARLGRRRSNQLLEQAQDRPLLAPGQRRERVIGDLARHLDGGLGGGAPLLGERDGAAAAVVRVLAYRDEAAPLEP